MKEHPIIYCAESIRGILALLKMQTRRLITKRHWRHVCTGVVVDREFNRQWRAVQVDGEWYAYAANYNIQLARLKSPYQVGDRLWARETFSTSGLTEYHYTGDVDDHGGANDPCCAYAATATYKCGKPIPPSVLGVGGHKWKPSIHMPRKFSRITQEVTAVRAERVQDISEVDAKAEGVCEWWASRCDPDAQADEWVPKTATAAELYRDWWDELNAKRAPWSSNPWVWVIDTKLIEE